MSLLLLRLPSELVSLMLISVYISYMHRLPSSLLHQFTANATMHLIPPIESRFQWRPRPSARGYLGFIWVKWRVQVADTAFLALPCQRLWFTVSMGCSIFVRFFSINTSELLNVESIHFCSLIVGSGANVQFVSRFGTTKNETNLLHTLGRKSKILFVQMEL